MRTEPAAISAAIAALANLLVLIVFDELDPAAQAAIVTAITVIAGLFIRSQVTPTSKLDPGPAPVLERK